METFEKRLLKKIDLGEIDIGQVSLNIAESQMDDYEFNRNTKDAWTYLHVAETNLMGAKKLGKDVSKYYERLQRLQSELPPRNLF